MNDIGPRASLALNILIMPLDPQPEIITEVMWASGKFLGYSTFFEVMEDPQAL